MCIFLTGLSEGRPPRNTQVRGWGAQGAGMGLVGSRPPRAGGGGRQAAGLAGLSRCGRSAENSPGHVETCEFTGTTWRRREGCSAGWVAWWPRADGAWPPVRLLVGFPC